MVNKFLDIVRSLPQRKIKLLVVLGVIIFLLFLLSGCSQHWKPMVGAGLGGGVGSIGGPAGAVAGGSVGYAVGEFARTDDPRTEQIKEQAEVIKAFSEGDVQKLVDLEMDKQKGWTTTLMDGVYNTLMFCAIGIGLYIFVPILYSRYLHKQTHKTIKENEEGRNKEASTGES